MGSEMCIRDSFTALGHLIQSDQSDSEYRAWVRDANNLPPEFKLLRGINLKDRPQCVAELFPKLYRGKSVIDYFLAHVVFPKEMKEFPSKLSASGWDIGKRKELVMTGFSGTNDSRRLLPCDVGHLDLDEQRHTNALVLQYLLQPENSVQLVGSASQSTSVAEYLLETVLRLEPPVEVILDVGAQILELNNLEVASTWLTMHNPDKDAAVFVNDADELCVVDRQGRVDLLQTSSFASRLDTCLIFLDEAHTRGIDLRLPLDYRAAVTLGTNLAKDRLVQACMRMRKLGQGQSVVFLIFREIQNKIVEQTSQNQTSDINVHDVLLWSISQTHEITKRNMPLWAVQGQRFVRQDDLWSQIRQNGHTILDRAHAEKFLEDEAQSVGDRYRPRQAQNQPQLFHTDTAISDSRLTRIIERCAEFENLQINSSTLQEEQERELSPETEQERQVQRAAPAKPGVHFLHPDVLSFANNGVVKAASQAYMPAFSALSKTSPAAMFATSQLVGDRKLLATVDFINTVEGLGAQDVTDSFQRPVQWVLSSSATNSSTVGCVMIISPFEANQLHPRMRSSWKTTLHLYKARTNSGYTSLDDLSLYTVPSRNPKPTVPRSLAIQLDLFAGQLYLSSYEDYLDVCSFLHLCPHAITKEMSDQGWKVDAEGFILSLPPSEAVKTNVEKSPINFFKVFLSKIRRDGGGIGKTHMGDLLEGKTLQGSDFEG